MSTVRGRRKAKVATISDSLKKTAEEQALRKSLSTLQPAADNPSSLVGNSGKSVSRKVEKLKPALGSKENSPMKTRRSKRKAVVSSSEETAVISSTPVSNDARSAENVGVKQKTLTKYSKKFIGKLKDDLIDQGGSTKELSNHEQIKKEASDYPEVNFSGISVQSGSSGYCSDGLERPETDINSGPFVERKSVGVAAEASGSSAKVDHVSSSEGVQSSSPSIPQEVYDLLISDKVPNQYWKDLAEQRRLALEEALHENELLHDQLEVLEAENSRLKSLVNDAEKLAEVVKDILGDSE